MADPAMRPSASLRPLGVYLMVSDGYGACEFYKRAFGADVTETIQGGQARSRDA